ncbi:MAG: hypothetical protein QXW00_04215 [Candidatus Woesearchaeota archaeon]
MDILDLNAKRGKFLLLVGPMNSGKTETAIRWAENIANHTDCNLLFFKPDIDVRSPKDRVISNSSLGKLEFPAITISSQNPEEALEIIKNEKKFVDAIFFDELNFFNKKIVEVIEELRKGDGRQRIIVGTGLDKTFRGEPFEPVDLLILSADEVEFHHAYCKHILKDENGFKQCKKPASYTMRLVLSEGKEKETYDFFDKENRPVLGKYLPVKYYDPTIVVERKESGEFPRVYYISVCRDCFKIDGKRRVVEVYDFIRKKKGASLEEIVKKFSEEEDGEIITFLKEEKKIYERNGKFFATSYEYDYQLKTYLPKEV